MAELEPTLLTTFLAIVDSGRISAAARTLHLSQPAVTAQLRRLEAMLGTPLFLRSARGVVPTEAGARLAEHARAIRRMIDDAVAAVARTPATPRSLAIAASTTVSAHILPPLLAAFRARHRDVAYTVHVENTEAVVESVREGRVPLGLVEGLARAPGVRLEPFLDDEIVPIASVGAPFRVRNVRDLAAVPILWREAGSGTRAIVERALRKAGAARRRNRLDIDLGSTEAILGGVVAGLGVAFVSRVSIRAHLAAGLVRLLPGLDLVVRRTFHFALPAGALGGIAAEFHAFVVGASQPRRPWSG